MGHHDPVAETFGDDPGDHVYSLSVTGHIDGRFEGVVRLLPAEQVPLQEAAALGDALEDAVIVDCTVKVSHDGVAQVRAGLAQDLYDLEGCSLVPDGMYEERRSREPLCHS